MANGIQITIVGNLTADPELKFSDGGTAQLNFSVATERSYKKDDEWVNEVSYPDVIAWRQLAEDSGAVLLKGMRVIVTGRFEQRFWDDKDTGQKRSKWQLVADEIAVCTKVIESLERKRRPEGEGQQQRGNNSRPTQRSGSGSRPASRQPVAASSGGEDW